MRRWPVIIGGLLVFFGIVALINAIWHIELGRYLWPILLIGAGVLLLVKPRLPGWWMFDWMTEADYSHKGESYQKEAGQSGFIGDRTIELLESDLPVGQTHYSLKGFIGDITFRIPAEVGIKVRGNCFVSQVDLFGEESTGVMAPVEAQSAHFDSAAKQVIVDMNYFVCDLKIRLLNK